MKMIKLLFVIQSLLRFVLPSAPFSIVQTSPSCNSPESAPATRGGTSTAASAAASPANCPYDHQRNLRKEDTALRPPNSPLTFSRLSRPQMKGPNSLTELVGCLSMVSSKRVLVSSTSDRHYRKQKMLIPKALK